MAEMTIRRLHEWAMAVPGLFAKIMIAFIWSVVDHAALPEAKELARLAAGSLEAELKKEKKTLFELTGGIFKNASDPPRAEGGDSFHKSSLLVAQVAEQLAFGRARGVLGKDVYSAKQALLDQHYYEKNGDGELVVQARL